MKAVLISIRPKWVEKIAIGKKTIEVRKTAPKIETPFKCYIYETKAQYITYQKGALTKYGYGRGKVIGEFICDSITKYDYFTPYDSEDFCHAVPQGELGKTCLENYELDEYLGRQAGYGWHISNLKIYDKPKELSEFIKPCEVCGYKELKLNTVKRCGNCSQSEFLTRPPQSYCYVEELSI